MKIKPFIDKCNWERINYPSEKDDWKKFEKNHLTIALHFFRTQNKLESNIKVYDFCNIVMHSEDRKSDKAPFII